MAGVSDSLLDNQPDTSTHQNMYQFKYVGIAAPFQYFFSLIITFWAQAFLVFRVFEKQIRQLHFFFWCFIATELFFLAE